MTRRPILIMAWLALAIVAYVTLSPIKQRPVVLSPELDRFVAFAPTGLAFFLGYPRRIWRVVTPVLGSAFALETLQLLTPDRHGRRLDALVEAAGGGCGIGAGGWWGQLSPSGCVRRIKPKRGLPQAPTPERTEPRQTRRRASFQGGRSPSRVSS